MKALMKCPMSGITCQRKTTFKDLSRSWSPHSADPHQGHLRTLLGGWVKAELEERWSRDLVSRLRWLFLHWVHRRRWVSCPGLLVRLEKVLSMIACLFVFTLEFTSQGPRGALARKKMKGDKTEKGDKIEARKHGGCWLCLWWLRVTLN